MPRTAVLPGAPGWGMPPSPARARAVLYLFQRSGSVVIADKGFDVADRFLGRSHTILAGFFSPGC
ncbi:hypothetical protein GCM10017556_24090 [Micromonospora sagamiensis]|nr:hypothetical protein GCM10017556_24090 [Micromonospora sagamiensis]